MKTALVYSLRFEQVNYRVAGIPKAHEKTFRWIWDEPGPGYVSWLRGVDGLFWITGKPGCGKSTLMKYILDEPRTRYFLTRSPASQVPLVAAFFFHDRGTQLQKSHDGLFRTILIQLVQKESQICKAIVSRLRAEGHIPTSETPSDVRWSEDLLKTVFETAIE